MPRYYLGWWRVGYSSGLQDLAAWNLHSISFGAACFKAEPGLCPRKVLWPLLGDSRPLILIPAPLTPDS